MHQPDERIYHLHAEVCRAIAHPARLKVLDVLRDGEECVCRLAPKIGVTESNLSQLLGVLRRAGLLDTRRDGHIIYYRIRDDRIFEVIDRMREILADQLAHIEDLSAALPR